MRSSRDPVLLGALGLRVAYGAGLAVAPERLTRRWLGPGGGRGPTGVAVRGLGVREIALHGAAIAAVLAGRPVRPLLAASVAGDLADIATTTGERHALPSGAAPATAVVAGVSAAISVLLAIRAQA